MECVGFHQQPSPAAFPLPTLGKHDGAGSCERGGGPALFAARVSGLFTAGVVGMHGYNCVCVCLCVCVRACVRACMWVTVVFTARVRGLFPVVVKCECVGTIGVMGMCTYLAREFATSMLGIM
jgi:hypothetical protein